MNAPQRPPLGAPTPPASTGEIELIQRAQLGDESAFEALMRTHHEPVFRLVVGMVRNEHDARELCQDIWVTVWQRLSSFRHESKFSTWLHPIAARRALDHLRKRRRWFDRFRPFSAMREGHVPSEPEATDPGPDAAAAMEGVERQERFERLLSSLPPHHRAVLVLREVQGLSYQEIAHLLHCRPGTVMSRLFHARRLLAQKLKDFPCD